MDGLHALDALLSGPHPVDALRAEALKHLQREGSWRALLRALGVLLAVLLTFRLAFDAVLPRLLLAMIVGGAVVAVAVLALHHLNETRRQRNLLAAFGQLAALVREHPGTLPELAPQIDALLGALRANAAVWPSRAPDALTRALARAVATTPPDAP